MSGELYAISDLAGYASEIRLAAARSVVEEIDAGAAARLIPDAEVIAIIQECSLGSSDAGRPLLNQKSNERIFRCLVRAIVPRLDDVYDSDHVAPQTHSNSDASDAPAMSFQGPADESVIHSALVLRDAIAKAPEILQPLGGFCVFVNDDELKTRHDFLNDDDVPPKMYSDVQLAVGEYLETCSVSRAQSFVSRASLPESMGTSRIKFLLPGIRTAAAVNCISPELLRRLYDAASPGTFGDMRSMETRVDPLVRSGREIDSAGFAVSPEMCKWVEHTWAEHFHPRKVRVEPYKINLYGPGDRFAVHRDTPDRNLVGTFLLALSGWGPPCTGGGLIVHDTGGVHRWNGASGWASFNPYLPHEVEPVTAGARATLAFKVFALSPITADESAGFDEGSLAEAAETIKICANELGQVGVLLALGYSLNGTALCGRDLFIYRVLERLGAVESIPVAVHIKGEAKSTEDAHWFADASVYALSPENLTRIAMPGGAAIQPKQTKPAIPFISTAGGYEVYNDSYASVEWAGNSAEAANVDTLYVHRALIVMTPTRNRREIIRCRGIDLRKVDLSGRDLRKADLEDACLHETRLVRSKLQRANLVDAQLCEAVLNRAQLQRANLTDALLIGATLDKANLTGATLRRADLTRASLKATVLTAVVWDYETTWPEGFDPLEHGAPMPVDFVNVPAKGAYPDPDGTIVNSLGMKFVPIAPGTFLMGTPGDDGEEYLHQVRITKPFLLGMHQVTQGQYEKATGENPSLFKAHDLPVEHLSWHAAARFCDLISALAEERCAGRRYRLPTEAEWEYACRAGTTTAFNTGDDLESHQAHYALSSRSTAKHTMPVGSFPPNPWGLYDMHGNVWEWTNDWFSADYFRDSPVDDPRGPSSGTHHTLRGGSASTLSRECRSAIRGEAARTDGPETESPQRFARYGDFGIRVVCMVDNGS